jgi:hypothetical protein
VSDRLHVVPVDDLVEHDIGEDGDCVCGPDVEFREDGEILYVHHSLDGRERFERDAAAD